MAAEPVGLVDVLIQMTSMVDRAPTYWLTEEFTELKVVYTRFDLGF